MTIILKEFSFHAEKAMGEQEALIAINKLAIEPVSNEDVYVGRMRLANDQLDRSYEKFSLPILERFAQTLPGKPVLEGHDKSKSPAGRFFSASLARDENGVTHLVADYYLPARSDLTARVKMGIASGTSIGFTAAGRTCDLCGEKFETCPHAPGQEYDGKPCTVTYSGEPCRYEAMEGSFVWVGCQRGAQAMGVKALMPGAGIMEDQGGGSWLFPGVPGEDEMEKAELEARVKSLESENAALLAESRYVADGKQYHTDLLEEIARQLGVMERPAELPLKLLANADLASLKEFSKTLGEEINQKFPPTPSSKMLGQPNGAALVPDIPGEGKPVATGLRGSVFSDWQEE